MGYLRLLHWEEEKETVNNYCLDKKGSNNINLEIQIQNLNEITEDFSY